MRKQIFTRMRKTLAILELVCLIMFLTAASASASNDSDYKKGYDLGFKVGYKVGFNAGNEDCHKYGQQGILKKIPKIKVKDYWPKSFTEGCKKGFKAGFVAGYNKARFKCLEAA
jgi:flagellar biosynthesis/type III secretory pathway protein FliH